LLNGTAPTYPSLTPVHNPPISSLNLSPIKTSTNDDVKVHLVGGYVIRESSQPFSKTELNKQPRDSYEQIRCIICQKLDSSQRFFDKDKKLCSNLCSTKANENIPPFQTMQTEIEEPIALPPDYGLPHDPSKWTVRIESFRVRCVNFSALQVHQVGEFIGRLTNDIIRQTFHESEMDGQALLLMTPEHLRETLKIKLGPSLIIASEIDKLRERVKTLS